MPGVVLMPFVAIFGVTFSDVLFCLTLGAVNVALISHLLSLAQHEGLINLSVFQRGILVIFFAFGTVQFPIAPLGQVWFIGQLTGFCFVALSYIAALSLRGSKAFFFTGLAIACAMLTRNHLIFLGIWPGVYLISKHWADKPLLLRNTVLALIPPFLLGVLFLVYNYQRFGSWTEVGISYHKMAEFFIADYKKYGYFNIHYVPINFYYQYIFYPLPLRPETLMGGSLFLLSPIFAGVFLVNFKKDRKLDLITLLISILLTNLPILLLMGTGWVQFGPRYTLDFTVPLLLFCAMGIKRMPNLPLILCTAISILHYSIGAYLFATGL
jgi:hypothetical protein